MRLRDALLVAAAIAASGMLLVLWTEYAYQRGYTAASDVCYEGSY